MVDYRQIARRFHERLGLPGMPVALYYARERPADAAGFKGSGRGRCVISLIYQASQGRPAAFDAENFGCPGAGKYLGLREMIRLDLAYFLSCGIEGKLEGERYIKTPALAQQFLDRMPVRPAPAPHCVFYPLDRLPDGVTPDVVIFFAPPDPLSGLVVLADYANEHADSNTVVRFASGCGQLVSWPLAEAASERPHAVLGLFDASARPMVPRDVLSYAVPLGLLLEMVV
jgi:uncharacterized protein (DUF169 family)